MHFYDFETEIPENKDIYLNLVECEKRTDLLYTYKNSRIAEVDGVVAGSLLSYPGENYKELRTRSFAVFWPDYMTIDKESEQETGPGEYYLDTLAVIPEYRRMGIGRALLEDGIKRGAAAGYDTVTLIVDSNMPNLIRLYESVGFQRAEHRRIFGIDYLRMIRGC